MKKFLINRSREDGFTLIELLVVVIIIAILAAIAVPVYIGIQNNAKKSSIQSDVATTKLNVAAAFAEDQPYNKNLILKSGSPANETVTVLDADGNTLANGAAPQEFQVVGTDGNDLGGYTVTFKSGDASQTQKTGKVALASDPVYAQDFEDFPDGKSFGTNDVYGTISSAVAKSGTKSIAGIYSSTGGGSYIQLPQMKPVKVGKSYDVTGYVYLDPEANATSWYHLLVVHGLKDTNNSDVYNDKFQSYYFNNGTYAVRTWIPFKLSGVAADTRLDLGFGTYASGSNGSADMKIYLDNLKVTPTD